MNITLLDDEIEEILNSEVAINVKLIFNRTPGVVKVIKAIPHKILAEESVYDVDRVAYTYWLDCARYDVRKLEQNDKVIIDDVTYNVEVIKNEISGWAKVYLTKYDS